jgi:hypothetical protein
MIPLSPPESRCSAAAQKVVPADLLPFMLGRIDAAGMEERAMKSICVARPEVTSIDRRGFWLRWRDEELYLPFALFPWFEHATVAQLCRVEQLGRECLYWPGLDLELALDRIRHPMAAAQVALDC